MTNALRKIVLPATIAFFCALIGVNAYVASKNLRVMQDFSALRTDASSVQSAITVLDLDLQHIENGQRGYLLTGDDSYLAPYTQAVETLPRDFSSLQSRLAARPAKERALASELQAVAESKIDDADQTIRLRRKGYRHRAFLIVDSNRGRDLMDKAHSLLEALTSIETRNVAQYEDKLTSSTRAARNQVLLANAGLLAVTVLVLLAFDYRSKRVERSFSIQARELRATSDQLGRLTSTLSTSIQPTLSDMRTQAENLLSSDGGFLPRQGQERVQWISDATSYVNRVVTDLLQPPLQPPPTTEPASSSANLRAERRDPQPVELAESTELRDSQSA